MFCFIKSSELPAGKKTIHLHLVFKIKHNQFGEPVRFKVRLVLDGSQMIPNVEYCGSYAAVVDFANFRLLVSYGHARGWRIKQYDIVLAFTWARPQNLTFVCFVFALDGIVEGIPKYQVAELLWNLYCNKSDQKSWFKMFMVFLSGLGFTEVGRHRCVLIGRDNNDIIIIALYVDDIVATASNPDLFV